MSALPLTPSSHYLRCLHHEIHYTEWGAADAPVVIAWHGLARTGRDMDDLAQHLAGLGYRVLCPDTIGRGLSSWSQQPEREYCLDFYAQIACAFFDGLNITQAHWVGTSMGGAIGTLCASGLAQPSLAPRIRSLVLNDNAPELAQTAIDRIRNYAGQPPVFESMLALEAFLRQVYVPYGWLSDAQWRRMADTSARRLPDGRLTLHYDPAMVGQFIHHPTDYSIWAHYDALHIPVLCLRGAQSDLVLRDTTVAMTQRGPGARGQFRCVEIPHCGHAPALNTPEQLQLVSDFLRQ